MKNAWIEFECEWFNRFEVGDSFSTLGLDLFDHSLGSGAPAFAVAIASWIVDHYTRAEPGEQQGVLAADAVAGAGDDGHLAVQIAHDSEPPMEQVVSSSDVRPESGSRVDCSRVEGHSIASCARPFAVVDWDWFEKTN